MPVAVVIGIGGLPIAVVIGIGWPAVAIGIHISRFPGTSSTLPNLLANLAESALLTLVNAAAGSRTARCSPTVAISASFQKTTLGSSSYARRSRLNISWSSGSVRGNSVRTFFFFFFPVDVVDSAAFQCN